jgi:hypothetical protein
VYVVANRRRHTRREKEQEMRQPATQFEIIGNDGDEHSVTYGHGERR